LLRPDIATTGVISYPEVFPLSLYDPLGHEQSLVVNVHGKGLVVITGCGHPALERLVSRSEALFGLPVVGVVGGLHYDSASAEEIESHISFLKSRQPGLVALSPHDSNLQAIQAFQAAFPEAYQFVRVGSVIKFP
jgi:7,8-dihydropterin-6-yl-methyl-4-(beta-D-ribofuranosyl)aminobenzene 5'-phosphate synthase